MLSPVLPGSWRLTALRHHGELASSAGNGVRVRRDGSKPPHDELATRGVRAERGGAKLSTRAIAQGGVGSMKAGNRRDPIPGP